VKIAMRIKISGGRGDLTEWPDPGVPFWVDKDEGAALCAGGMAYPVAEYPGTEVRGTETPDPVSETSGRPVTETPALVTAGKPIVNSPKADWVDYAVTLGADRAGAEGSTKVDLIAWVKDREG
jgi:hypothetical protein